MLPSKVSKNLSNKFLQKLNPEEAVDLLNDLENTKHLHGKITIVFKEVKECIQSMLVKGKI
jgi:hypothetical protein